MSPLVALLTAKECHKLVHELYVPNEIRQEFLFVAMAYGVGSLSFKYVVRI
jgi:hypothetical protein